MEQFGQNIYLQTAVCLALNYIFFVLWKTSYLIKYQKTTLNFYNPSTWNILKYFTNASDVVFCDTICISIYGTEHLCFQCLWNNWIMQVIIDKSQTQAYLSLQISVSWIQIILSSNKRIQCR